MKRAASAPARAEETASRRETLKKVLRAVGGQRLLLPASLLLAAAAVLCQLTVPILFGDAVDGILGPGRVDFPLVADRLIRILALSAAGALLTWLMGLVNNRLVYRTVRGMRARAIRRIQRLPLAYLDAHSAGDLVQRVIADTDQLADGLLLGFSQLFSGVVTIGVTLFFMFSKDAAITLLVLALTPVSFLTARFISSRSYRLFRAQTELRGRQTARIGEMVGNAKVVKAFGREAAEAARFDEQERELCDCSRRAVFYSSLTNPSTRAVNNVIYALVALVGALRILTGGLSVGGLTALLSYANQYMKPFNDISSVIAELQNALACAARVFALIEAEPEPADAPALLPPARGLVELRHADFSYDKQRPLIEDLCFRAEPGTTTAIVGPTGCGKTTLINLLMRFYDVDRGGVFVDGTDVKDVARRSLRQNYGMVLQDTWIRNGTVRENIAFGRPEATDDEIVQAARDAHSWEFIRRMPDGLDTVLREDSLSQGQKQLLCITRVMLCRPPMLILDEATSSIDTRTEIRIQQAFARLMQGRTSFIVAHRLSTIQNADRILVMRDGRVVEQGDHRSLLARNGFYAELYRAQFAGEDDPAADR
ncbi:MAG: ABC transporter ATP-binding protein [Oscillospiraceae bacterium]|nr:ABC transporter ATP-binding protein [Oscillospiraceae bacterium]